MRTKKTSGIYKIENIINNKVYIGSSVCIEDRWIRHKTDLIKGKSCSSKLQNSFNKHGEENFEFHIIEECAKENLIEREQFYIDYHNSYDQGYNCCPVAGNTLGFSPTEETRIKIRKSLTGEKNHFYGKKHTEESRDKMRESHIGKESSFKGRTHTAETKKKISESKTGKSFKHKKKRVSGLRKGKNYKNGTKQSEETKLKIGEKLKGRKYSQETLRKMSKSKRKIQSEILQFDLQGNFIKEWPDLFSLKMEDFKIENITRACKVNGKSGGFIWKYKNKN